MYTEQKNVCIDIDKGNTLRPEIRTLIREEIKINIEQINQNDQAVCVRTNLYSKYIKRFFDIMISGTALLVLMPVNAVLAICAFFDVGRPIFFLQERVGKDMKKFKIVKFRNMNNKTDEFGNLLPGKDRVTKFGKFVRKTSLDELLNFWSILKGDMSIIGPRPLVSAYTDYLSDRHKMRYSVRPGLECPMIFAAEHGKTWADQFENDIWYVENISLLTDIKMMIALVKAVFNRKSSAARAEATRGSFMGYHPDGTSINSKCVPEEYILSVYQGGKLQNEEDTYSGWNP